MNGPRMLVSVRDVGEALAAAAAGADFIDLKEPRAGALGALAPARIREIVAALRRAHPDLPVSATIGDFEAGALDAIEARVAAVGACGVDYVKVGVTGHNAGALLARLAALPWPVVPVFIVDRGLDGELLAAACRLRFPALMADTQDKAAGSLFDCVAEEVLGAFVARVRAAGKLAGLAGALREAHLARIAALEPDFAGFRSAVCEGARTAVLDPARVRCVRALLLAHQAVAPA